MAQAQQAEQQLIDQQMAELQIMLENDINAAEKQQEADASSNSGSSSSSLSIQSSSSSSSSSSSGNIEGGSNTVWKTYTQVIDSLSNEFTDHERKIQWKEGIIYIIGSKSSLAAKVGCSEELEITPLYHRMKTYFNAQPMLIVFIKVRFRKGINITDIENFIMLLEIKLSASMKKLIVIRKKF